MTKQTSSPKTMNLLPAIFLTVGTSAQAAEKTFID